MKMVVIVDELTITRTVVWAYASKTTGAYVIAIPQNGGLS